MSDAAWAAFWSGFWANLGAIITAAVAGGVTVYMTWRNGQKAEAAKAVALETKAELSAQVNEVKATALTTKEELSAKVDAVKHVAVRSQHEITQAFQAGERGGYVAGIEVGKAQATGPGGVTDFNPLEK